MVRLRFLVVLFIMILGSVACGNSSKQIKEMNGDSEVITEVVNDKKSLTILQFKIEIVQEMEQLAEAYEKENPGVEIKMKTVAGKDYYGILRYEFASENPPDIYNSFGDRGLEHWLPTLLDMTDEPWVKQVKDGLIDPITLENRVYGLPYNVEGYGYVYNKELFDKAGIVELPKTYEALEATAKQLQEKGITPFYCAFQEPWVLTNHYLNTALANQGDLENYLQKVVNYEERMYDNPLLNRWLDLLELELRYSQPNPFMSDYNQQLIAFSKGEVAMIQQGNWIQTQLDQLNPNMELGMMPIPIIDGIESIPVGVAAYWVVNKDSEQIELATDFLNWMVSSDFGKDFMIDKLRFISPLNEEVEPKRLGQLSEIVTNYIEDDNTYGWDWYKLPEGYATELYNKVKSYLVGEYDRERFFYEAEQLLVEMY